MGPMLRNSYLGLGLNFLKQCSFQYNFLLSTLLFTEELKMRCIYYISISYLLRPCSAPATRADLLGVFCVGEYTLGFKLSKLLYRAPTVGWHLFVLHQVLFNESDL